MKFTFNEQAFRKTVDDLPVTFEARPDARAFLDKYIEIVNSEPMPESQQRITPEIDKVEAILRGIAKRPNLPNPERDADWRNCMKWSSHDAGFALELIPAIRAALQKVTVPVSGWQPIETAPKDGTMVLGWSGPWGEHVQTVWYWTDKGEWNVAMQPTHWMPTPAPPTAIEQEKVKEYVTCSCPLIMWSGGKETHDALCLDKKKQEDSAHG